MGNPFVTESNRQRKVPPLAKLRTSFKIGVSKTQSKRRKMEEKTKDDGEIISRAVKEMEEEGTLYKANGKPNIPLLMEKTGLTRQRARHLAKNDFKIVPHGNTGKKREKALTEEEVDALDSLLSKGETNSAVLTRELKDRFGYAGSTSSVKRYKYSHMHLVPAPRITVSLQGQRINRYETGPGFMYQMDWGFVNVNCIDGSVVRVAYLKKLYEIMTGKKSDEAPKKRFSAIMSLISEGSRNTRRLCSKAGVSPKCYYAHAKGASGKEMSDERLIAIIRALQETYGNSLDYRKMADRIKDDYGIVLGRKKVLRLMEEANALSAVRRKHFCEE